MRRKLVAPQHPRNAQELLGPGIGGKGGTLKGSARVCLGNCPAEGLSLVPTDTSLEVFTSGEVETEGVWAEGL